jgi:hypothetical protein
MANTKVTGDLIADGTITSGNLANSSVTAAKLNSITTDNISEGTNLFYTDARVGTYLSGNGYDTATNIIAAITDSAPTTLDTLNELAAALGDDPNFATTVTNSIATKLPLAGGTISGNLTVSGSLTGTLAAAAQPNVTSVGTLTGLTIGGTTSINNANLNLSNAYFLTGRNNANTLSLALIGRDTNDRVIIDADGYGTRIGSGSLLTVTAANVGIGTSSPACHFNVSGSGNGSVSEHIRITSTDIEAKLAFVTTTGNGAITQSGGDLRFMTNTANVERMRIASNGYVYINEVAGRANLNIRGTYVSGRYFNQVHCLPSNGDAEGGLYLGSISANNSIIANGNYYNSAGNHIPRAAEASVITLNADGITFSTNSGLTNGVGYIPTPRMRITNSGNVGIGTSSPIDKLHIAGGITSTSLATPSNTSIGSVQLGYDGTNGVLRSWNSSPIILSTFGHLQFDTSGSERMRVTSGGQLQVGGTTQSFNARIVIHRNAYSIESKSTGTGSEGHFVFSNGNGAVGSIFTNGTSTAYNTSSDYRLKEDCQPLEGALNRVDYLKPINFAWKVDGSRVDGFLAHQVAEVVPEAINGEKDAVDEKGNPIYQGIDQSKLVPLLTAAIQELKEIVDNQQQQINDLKAQLNG